MATDSGGGTLATCGIRDLLPISAAHDPCLQGSSAHLSTWMSQTCDNPTPLEESRSTY